MDRWLREELLGTHCFDISIHHCRSLLELHSFLLLPVLELVDDLSLDNLALGRLQSVISLGCFCCYLGLGLLPLESLVLLRHVLDRLLLKPDLTLGLFELTADFLGMLLELHFPLPSGLFSLLKALLPLP